MTDREQIIAAAKEFLCVTEFNNGNSHECYEFSESELISFYTIALEHGRSLEREEIAVLLDVELPDENDENYDWLASKKDSAATIRAMSTK